MLTRHPYDTSLAVHIGHERHAQAAEERLARMARRHRPHAARSRSVGRLLVRLGTRLGGAPETPAPARTMSPVRPR